MAFLENRNGKYRLKFCYAGQRYSRSLKTDNLQNAERAKSQVERNLELVSLGLLDVPNEGDVVEYLLSGKEKSTAERLKASTVTPKAKSASPTLKLIIELYFSAFPEDSIEKSTLDMFKTHGINLERLMGGKTKLSSINTATLQEYIDKRAKEKGRRGKIKPVTLRKEITTLYSVFEWAIGNGYLKELPSRKGLRYPKGKERPPFQTYREISRKIEFGGLSEDEIGEMWECLYLTTGEIEDVLRHVKENARHPFIYPMFAFAAHTGARRSEMLRSEVSDLDFDSDLITIREQKRVRGMQSSRRVPMTPFLSRVLRKWLGEKPNGKYTFCMEEKLAGSRKSRVSGSPISKDEMRDHFKRPLLESKWEVMHGWHLFRHSFCSNCAAAGVEQRIINDWVGHQTETMVRRYRHLFPNNQQKAIQSVFSIGVHGS